MNSYLKELADICGIQNKLELEFFHVVLIRVLSKKYKCTKSIRFYTLIVE